MKYALDTNVLARSIESDHPQNAEAIAAILALLQRAHDVYVLPQNLIEFWVISTRPRKENGLGLSPVEADAHLAKFESLFLLPADRKAVYDTWRRLVTEHEVRGKNAHDARIAAALMAHKITHLVTFNTSDFKRFTEITVLAPSNV